MKRLNEYVDEEGKNLNSKKGRILSSTDENANDSDKNVAVAASVDIENNGIESQADDTIRVPHNKGHISTEDTKDLTVISESDHKPKPFDNDLNIPFCAEDDDYVASTGEFGGKELVTCGQERVVINVDLETDESDSMMGGDGEIVMSPLDILAEVAVAALTTMQQENADRPRRYDPSSTQPNNIEVLLISSDKPKNEEDAEAKKAKRSVRKSSASCWV